MIDRSEFGSFLDQLQLLDLSLMSAVPTTATVEDCRSLLALQLVARKPGYTYLEIGSEKGGSLQTHLADPWCAKVFSIDLRVEEVADFRGKHNFYFGNTTASMRSNLEMVFGREEMKKLLTFDMEAARVPRESLTPAPSLIFIDAEHTDHAAYSDFFWALKTVDAVGWIAFHDAHLVCGGIRRALDELSSLGLEYGAGRFPDSSVFVIAIGSGAASRLSQIPVQLIEVDSFLCWARFTRWGARITHWRDCLVTVLENSWHQSKRFLRGLK